MNKQKINIACVAKLGYKFDGESIYENGSIGATRTNEPCMTVFNIFDDTKGDKDKVIEKFHISTECKIGGIWCCWINRSGNTNAYVRHGKTMNEAQIACICAVIGEVE